MISKNQPPSKKLLPLRKRKGAKAHRRLTEAEVLVHSEVQIDFEHKRKLRLFRGATPTLGTLFVRGINAAHTWRRRSPAHKSEWPESLKVGVEEKADQGGPSAVVLQALLACFSYSALYAAWGAERLASPLRNLEYCRSSLPSRFFFLAKLMQLSRPVATDSARTPYLVTT